MSYQSDARAEIATLLQSINLTVLDNPTNVNPWSVVIASADPVLTNSNTMGTLGDYNYNLLLQCVGDGQNSLVQLEGMVEDIILALGNSDDWFPGDASAPFWGRGGDDKYFLTITLPATKNIEIGGGN